MQVVLALGSNLGDRLGYLRLGVEVLRSVLTVTAVSSVYETDPVGGPEQGAFLNAVVLVEADTPTAALVAAHAAEHAAGRERLERWGPRTLDVDVVDAGGEVSGDPVLTLPHPRAHDRAFVLVPWDEVDPLAELPGHGAVGVLRKALGDSGIRLVGALE